MNEVVIQFDLTNKFSKNYYMHQPIGLLFKFSKHAINNYFLTDPVKNNDNNPEQYYYE